MRVKFIYKHTDKELEAAINEFLKDKVYRLVDIKDRVDDGNTVMIIYYPKPEKSKKQK